MDNAFAKFERFERKVDNLEGELQAMDLGRDANLAAEIDALGEEDWLDEELLRIKDSMAEAEPAPTDDAESKKT